MSADARRPASWVASWPVLTPILVGALLRVLLLVQVWGDPVFFDPSLEDLAHWQRAQAIADGGLPESVLPQGSFLYPYGVALLSPLAGGHPYALFIVQILMDLAVVLLIYRLGLRLAGRGAALAGALLYAVDPVIAAYAVRVSPVIPATLLFFYAASRLLPDATRTEQRLGGPVLTGIVIGVGTLLVPLPFLALGILTLAVFWSRRLPRRLAASAALIVPAALLTVPALVHNSRLDGGGFTFAWTDGWGFAKAFAPETWGSPWSAEPPSWQTPEELRFAVSPETGPEPTWGEVERAFVREGTRRFLDTPLPTLILILRKGLLALGRVEIPDPVPMAAALRDHAPLFTWGLLVFPVLLGLFSVELVATLRTKSLPLFAGIALTAVAADHLLGPVSGACRALALPLVAAFAGAGLLRTVRALRGRALGAVALPLAAGAVVAGISFADTPSAGRDLLREDEYLRLKATATEEAGDRPEAIRLLRRAARIASEPNPWVYADLAAYLAREGLYEESVETYEKAIRADSTHAIALLGAANVLRVSGGSVEAIAYLRKLVELYPNEPLYHNELGTLYMAMGQLAAARRELETAVVLRPDYSVALGNLRTLSQKEKEIAEYVVPPEMNIAPGDTLHAISQQLVQALNRKDVAMVDSLAAVARSIRPDHILADVMQGLARSNDGKWREALPFFDDANAKVPGRAYLVRQLVACYLQLGMRDEAVATLESALAAASDANNERLILDLKTSLEQQSGGSP